MKFLQCSHYALFILTICVICTCNGITDQQAVSAKESAEKALSEANTAERSKNVKFPTADEKMKNILEKSVSALGLAQGALGQVDAILQDKQQTSESKGLATEAKKEIKLAIKKVGSVLSSLE